jgi:N-acetylglucosaminyldiphosphoundecaprenol N-acetyl-beta-D-mannosaminyltransferase
VRTPERIRADLNDDSGAGMTVRRMRICDIPVDILTMDESIEVAHQLIRSRRPHQHVAINAAKVVAARHDPELREIIESCAIANADGQSIVWASRLLGPRLPERVTGIDFMLRMWEAAAEHGYRVYLLGSKPETVARAAEVAEKQGVKIVGSRSGYWSEDEEPEIVAEIARTGADLLFVGLPTPRKEQFLHRHLDKLQVPLAVGVGGSFDVVAGEVTRAPAWMQKYGLEWLHRMRQEPSRMLRRYFLGNVEFVGLVIREYLSSRKRAKSSPSA